MITWKLVGGLIAAGLLITAIVLTLRTNRRGRK